MMRLIWIFESELIIHLFLGYELDKSLTLRKTENGFLNYLCSNCSSKILSDSLEIIPEEQKQIHHKYSKFHSKEELDAEIKKIKETIRCNQLELAHVENLIFLSSESSHSGHRYSENDPPQHNGSRHSFNSQRAHSSHSLAEVTQFDNSKIDPEFGMKSMKLGL